MLLKTDPTKIRHNKGFSLLLLILVLFKAFVPSAHTRIISETYSGPWNTTSAALKAYSDTKNSFSRSFHRVKTKVICKYVMLAIANDILQYESDFCSRV